MTRMTHRFAAILILALPVMALGTPFTLQEEDGRVIARWHGPMSELALEAPIDDDLAALREHPGIEIVEIRGCSIINGSGFQALKALPKLTTLRLIGVSPEPGGELFDGDLAGYRALAELDQLKHVSFDQVQVSTPGAVLMLEKMDQLESFRPGCAANDALIIAASLAGNLRVLEFGDWPTVPAGAVTIEGFSHYGFMVELKHLGTGVQAPGDAEPRLIFETLSQLNELEKLEFALGGPMKQEEMKGNELPPLDEAELQPLSRLKQLSQVTMKHTLFGETGLQVFVELPGLQRLELDQCHFSEIDLALLRETLPNLKVIVQD